MGSEPACDVDPAVTQDGRHKGLGLEAKLVVPLPSAVAARRRDREPCLWRRCPCSGRQLVGGVGGVGVKVAEDLEQPALEELVLDAVSAEAHHVEDGEAELLLRLILCLEGFGG